MNNFLTLLLVLSLSAIGAVKTNANFVAAALSGTVAI